MGKRPPESSESCPQAVLDLVARFERNRDTYRATNYNETQLRREFLDPFFKALGWDIDNEQGLAEAYKDVIHEDAIKIGGATKAPDYCFRIGGTRKFFVEAKRPFVGIKDEIEPAYQLRRYAWSTKLPLSILTDLKELTASKRVCTENLPAGTILNKRLLSMARPKKSSSPKSKSAPTVVPTACKDFGDYRPDAASWITLATGEYYPDILPEACELYKPVLVMFGQILKRSESSSVLFKNICELKETWMRIQLARVFRKYVSPSLSVEMLKKKSQVEEICEQFAPEFRPIQEVQKAFASRPIPDEAICAVLWEYKSRGQKGYDLTEKFFAVVRAQLLDYEIIGPERAGKDVLLGTLWPDYPKPDRPADFIIQKKGEIFAVGFARYDSDRGGAQEDDRTGGYRECASEVLSFASQKGLTKLKVIFLNDGPGLLLGSMWSDYAYLERTGGGRIRVVTLRMVSERITTQWLEA